MAHASPLPLWKAAMDLAVHLEQAVRRFPRYHKYTLGTDLRHALRVQGQAHAVMAQTGHFRSGFKRRGLVACWAPPPGVAAVVSTSFDTLPSPPAP